MIGACAAAGACGGSSEKHGIECEDPGDVQACSCVGQPNAGTMTCQDDGYWSDCDCENPYEGGAGSGGAAGSSGSSQGGGDSTPGIGGSEATAGRNAGAGTGGSAEAGGTAGTTGSGGATAGSAGNDTATGGLAGGDGGGGAIGGGGSGGAAGSGGSGGASTGGATGSGGSVASAGAAGSGGSVASAGAAGSGGSVASAGAAGSGGSVASAGAAGSGGSVASAGAAGSGGSASLLGGYHSHGDWAGFAFTLADGGATITPDNFDSMVEQDGPYCVTGTVVATAAYASIAALGVNVSQLQVEDASVNALLVSGSGLRVDFTVVSGADGLRIQLEGADSDNNPDHRWCVDLTGSQDVVIPWASFNTECWDTGTGTAFDPVTDEVARVLIHVPDPGSTGTDQDFDFCLNDIGPE